MASTKQLLTSVGSSASLAVAAVAQALDPKFPWDKATILRVSGNNPRVAQALEMEAVLTLPTTPKARKAPKAVKAPKVKPVSAWLMTQLEDAATLVLHLQAFGAHEVTVVADDTELTGFIATLGEPTVGSRGGVSVMATLKPRKGQSRTYELSGKQAARLFAGGNCGTTVGHVLKSA